MPVLCLGLRENYRGEVGKQRIHLNESPRYHSSFLKIQISFFFLVMETSAIGSVISSVGLLQKEKLVKGISLKITLVLEKWRAS